MDRQRECTCKKYSKTTDEIVKATVKHRDAVISLKEISEKQKVRLCDYKMKVEQLEYDLDESERRESKYSNKNKEMEVEIKALKSKLKSREAEKNTNEDALLEENEQLKERVTKLCNKVENNLKDIGQFCWDLEEAKKEISEKGKELEVFEKRKEVTDKVIKDIQRENQNLKVEVERYADSIKSVKANSETVQQNLLAEVTRTKDLRSLYEDTQDAIKNLSEEVEKLNKENISKECSINEINIEKEILYEKLGELQKENVGNKELFEKEEFVDNSECLSAELGRIDAYYRQVRLDCDSCGEFFSSKKNLNNHRNKEHKKVNLITKELELEKLILERKFKLSSTLIKLNQKETSEAKSCNCRGSCKIFHELYNWKFSNYKSIVHKFSSLYPCTTCDEQFCDSGTLKRHIEVAHKETEEEKVGEID